MKTRTGITRRALFSGLMAATLLAGVGCSSGGSSSGIGTNYSGNYSGVLRSSNGAQIATVQMSLIDTGVSSADSTVTAGTVTGQVIVNSRNGCPEGGNISAGSNTVGRLQLTAGDMNITLSPTGGGLSGLWSISGSTTTSTDGTTSTSSGCSAQSGTIVLN